MPHKYHIDTKPAPPRFRTIGKLGIVDWREDCSNCHNCVKRACVYGFWRDEADTLRDEITILDYIYQCKGCLACVQNCTKGLLTRVVNPEYERLGDAYYTPDIVLSNWYQAETGNIPVSGSGYGGPFSGPGFDSMWTDMSEIVRPTRDGIHGREYINTSVDIGRKPPHLMLAAGTAAPQPPPLVEIPLPIIFENVPGRYRRGAVMRAVANAAAEIGTLFVADACGAEDLLQIPGAVPFGVPDELESSRSSLIMTPDSADVIAFQKHARRKHPNQIVAIRVPATPDAAKRICELTRAGAECVHLVFDTHGREIAAENPRHMRDVLREVHRALVKEGIRDLVTLSASGGIAQAEHVAKAIICGADFVAVDLPLMIALECRLCGACDGDAVCPVDLDEIDEAYGVRRIVNLIAAWRNQLLELLGAMGIREMRRLRGETGRCMFFEDLEAATFGRLFGKRRQGV